LTGPSGDGQSANQPPNKKTAWEWPSRFTGLRQLLDADQCRKALVNSSLGYRNSSIHLCILSGGCHACANYLYNLVHSFVTHIPAEDETLQPGWKSTPLNACKKTDQQCSHMKPISSHNKLSRNCTWI